MYGHADFGAVQQLWSAFWKGTNKTPLYSITIPKNGRDTPPRPPYLAGFDGRYQEAADTLARWVEGCEFYGGAIPYFAQSFGSDDCASLLGADLRMSEATSESGGTSWPVHTLDTLAGARIAFDRNGKWWNRTLAFHDVLKRTLGDAMMIAAPTLSSGLDALVGLYGANRLLLDMADEPCSVKEALAQINAAFTEMFAACAEVFEFDRYGSINRHGMYVKGRINLPQCDFSCMISSEMFEEFAVPCLEHEFGMMDAGEYHLDGPGAIRHLERLVRIPGLHVIQWVPGAGEAAAQDWTHLYKRIIGMGKGLILGGSPDRMEAIQSALGTRRLFATVHGLKTRTEAEDYLCRMEKLWEKREC